MSTKAKRKPKADSKDLKAHAHATATAFHLIANGQHPGNSADAVLLALKFLDTQHANLIKQIEALEPEVVPVAPVPEVVPTQAVANE